MKRLTLFVAVAFIVALALPAFAGNGAPSGPHYNLNIIGVSKDKKASMSGSDRHTIFVKLGSTDLAEKSYIYLTQGEFKVCDGNASDQAYDCAGDALGNKTGAVFQLPCNTNVPADSEYECTGYSQSYTVWVRELGKPGGSADMTLCATDITPEPDVTYCNTGDNIVALLRVKGKSQFKNVTNQLTMLTADIDDDGVLEHVALFQGGLEEWFWEYNNKGLKLAQLRFYPE